MIDRYKMLVFRGVKNSVYLKGRASQAAGKLWQNTGLLCLMLAAFTLSGCANGLPTFVALDGPASNRISGYVVSDSPQAALIGSYALEDGGTAADASVAAGFALSVSLPSRAGLGGGGACLYFDAASSRASLIEFMPTDPVIRGQPPRFSTAVPGMVRGLFALHAEHGRLPWNANLVRAEASARFGDKVSRSLAADLANHSAALVNDRAALDRFMTNRRQFLQEGDTTRQVGMAGLLGRVRSGQAGAFYAGGLAQLLAEQAQLSGGALNTADLNAYRVKVSQLPRDTAADQLFKSDISAGSEQASTAVTVLDTYGNAASCVFTMGQPFGAGLMIEDFGMLLSMPPEQDRRQNLSIQIREGAGVLSVSAGAVQDDVSISNAVECNAGVRVAPDRCQMTVRPQLSGLAVQAGERR